MLSERGFLLVLNVGVLDPSFVPFRGFQNFLAGDDLDVSARRDLRAGIAPGDELQNFAPPTV